MCVCEDCIGLYAIEITNADRLTIISIKDVLIHSSLSLSRCCGQCYDGAANISGKRSGVATQIQMEEPRAIIYLHCMGHSLNLAVQDTCQSIMSDTFDTVLELSKTLKYSSKKKAMLLSLRALENNSLLMPVRPLCPARWTVHTESLSSIIANYEVIQ